MEVRFTKGFIKEMKKHLSRAEALSIIKKLSNTNPSEGKIISIIGDIVLKEKKLKSFRFYFVFRQANILFMNERELRERILLFIQISKKNNQQRVIEKLIEDLKKNGFRI
ncbi:MAG: hypothetical protein ACMXYL_02940 [Candidatus Woesearchaeota archaeon]